MSDFADPIPDDQPPEEGEMVAQTADVLAEAEEETEAAHDGGSDTA